MKMGYARGWRGLSLSQFSRIRSRDSLSCSSSRRARKTGGLAGSGRRGGEGRLSAIRGRREEKNLSLLLAPNSIRTTLATGPFTRVDAHIRLI